MSRTRQHAQRSPDSLGEPQSSADNELVDIETVAPDSDEERDDVDAEDDLEGNVSEDDEDEDDEEDEG